MRVDHALRGLSVLAIGVGCLAAATSVGCSSAAKDSKSSLPVCDESDPTCASNDSTTEKPSKSSKSSSSSSSSSSGPSSPKKVEDPPPPTADGGGAEAAAPEPAPSCADLDKCCAELVEAGYEPSTCKSIVATNNNAACYASLARYVEYGDCS